MDLNKTFSAFPEDTFCEIDSQSFPKLDSGNISDISIHPYVVFNNNKRKFSDLDSDPENTIPLNDSIKGKSSSDITPPPPTPSHQNCKTSC